LKNKAKLREVGFSLILCLSILGAIVAANSPGGMLGVAATCSGISGCVSTPSLYSSTSYSYTATTATTSTTTSSSFSTSISSSTTTTTATTISTFFSATSTISTTLTTTSFSTTYTGTSTSTNTGFFTVPTTTTTASTYTNLVTVKGTPVPACPVAFAIEGTPLEPFANDLRNFRDNVIQNTTAGREFLLTFNSWYYSWAPSVSYSANQNPWLLKGLQAGVYPLIGILYASRYSYALAAPFSTEAGALAAGMVAASLIGAVYLAPGAYILIRILGRQNRLDLRKLATSSSLWLGISTITCAASYATGSGVALAFGISSMVLSTLSLGSFFGAKVATYAQGPIANFAHAAFAHKRFMKLQY